MDATRSATLASTACVWHSSSAPSLRRSFSAMADESRVSSRRCARRFRAAAPAPASNSRNCHRIGRRRASSSWMTASLGKRHGGHRPRQKLRRTAEGSNLTKRYLEDFAVGQTFGSGRVPVDKERIKTFAAEFDPQPFHLDEEAARNTVFRGLAASGWHTAALTMRLVVENELKPAGGTSAPASTS